MALDDQLKDLSPAEQERIKALSFMLLEETQAKNEYVKKYGEPRGIRWKRFRNFQYSDDNSSIDFNTFFTSQVKQYKNELLLNNPEQRSEEPKPAQHMLIERHNLERLTTSYSFYPTDDQFDEVESHIHQRRNIDDPDYYVQICHTLKPIRGHIEEVVMFIGCRKGRWIGRRETYLVNRFIKHDIYSDIINFRQIKLPEEEAIKWHKPDIFQ